MNNLLAKLSSPEAWNRMASDPMFNIGLGLLSNPNQSIGQGLRSGLLSYASVQANQQRSQQAQLEMELARARLAEAQREQAVRQQQAQMMSRYREAVESGDKQRIRQAALLTDQFAPTALKGLLSEPGREALKVVMTPNGPVYLPESQAVGKPAPHSGMSLTVGPDGQVQFAQGAGLTTKTENTLQEKQFNSLESLSRLNAIQQAYQPGFQRFGDRLALGWSQLKDSAGVDLSSTDKAALSEFSTFKRRAIDNINQEIKAMSGAAVTVQEAGRMKAALPSAGTGVFDGDSPVVFESKLNDTIEMQRNAARRYEYARRQGLNWQSIPLSRVPSLVQQRGEDLAREFMSRGMDEKQATEAAVKQLRKEFGQ